MISPRGLRVTMREWLARRMRLPEIPVALARLAGLGFTPEFVFDVGAYRGDFARVCLSLWPRARVVCFEPLEDQLPTLRTLASVTGRVDVIESLVGSTVLPAVPLHRAETASSILEEHSPNLFETRSYAMTTIDAVVASSYSERSPDLLKIDVQGYELEVLKGAVKSLTGISAVLAEVNLLDIHRQVPLAHEVVNWLAERGFVAYDICGLVRRPLDDALWQADILFVPENSALREDKRWSR